MPTDQFQLEPPAASAPKKKTTRPPKRKNLAWPAIVVAGAFIVMLFLKYFPDYLVGIGQHWVVLMSGLVSVVLTIWEKHLRVPHNVFYAIAALCVFIAGFMAWRDEYQKTHPGVVMEIDQVAIGNAPSGDARLFITAELVNRSDPTMLDSWRLDIETPGGEKINDIAPGYARGATWTTQDGGIIAFKDEDILFFKTTTEPLAKGARVAGVIFFEVRGKKKDYIGQIGALFRLKCRNASREAVTAEYIWHGGGEPFLNVPGLKTPPQ
jgi:hypothetical protein